MKKLFWLLFILPFLFSCSNRKKEPKEQQQFKHYVLTEVWRTDTSIRVPESVIYDEKRNILYVSDLNYEPRKKDKNGFITRLSTDGKIVQLHWVDGLNSPKGLGIVDDKLYAADIDELVEIDIEKGAITNRYTIDGIKMINDIASDQDGNLYISDSDANKIYIFRNGEMKVWLDSGLNSPNGLFVDGSRLMLASQGTKDFCAIDMKTKQKTIITQGIGRGDGIASTGVPGEFLVTDWEGEIFIVHPDGSKESLLNTKAQKSNCADIWFIPSQQLMILPTFYSHYVVGYKLTEK